MAARKMPPRSRAEGSRAAAATRRRQSWEAANPDRMQTISEQQFGKSGMTNREAGVSPRLAYRLAGYHEDEVQSPHPHGQMELPGMTSVKTARESGLLGKENTPAHQSRTLPDLAPTPPRWEDMPKEAQEGVLRKAAQFGVSMDSLHHSFSAQLDQGHARAAAHGMTPYASHFYSGDDPSRPSTPEDMQPRDVLKGSAKTNDVDFSTQVLANAITSPKAKFRATVRGTTTYPNNEAANVAIQGIQAGQTPKQVKKPPGLVVMQGNITRAAHAVSQRELGASMEDIRNPGGKQGPGGPPFGAKTGPYANSFMDPHGSSQFFVSDVHSGGAGMAPHIPHEAPFKRDEAGDFQRTASGKPKRDQSEREKYLGIKGIHSLHDYVARNVLHERGLSSLSGAQATQWGEEQVSRGETFRGARKVTLVSTEDAYRKQPMHEEVHGQMDMFGGSATPAPHSAAPARRFDPRVDEPDSAQERRASEAVMAQNNRRTWGNVRTIRQQPGFKGYEGWD